VSKRIGLRNIAQALIKVIKHEYLGYIVYIIRNRYRIISIDSILVSDSASRTTADKHVFTETEEISVADQHPITIATLVRKYLEELTSLADSYVADVKDRIIKQPSESLSIAESLTAVTKDRVLESLAEPVNVQEELQQATADLETFTESEQMSMSDQHPIEIATLNREYPAESVGITDSYHTSSADLIIYGLSRWNPNSIGDLVETVNVAETNVPERPNPDNPLQTLRQYYLFEKILVDESLPREQAPFTSKTLRQYYLFEKTLLAESLTRELATLTSKTLLESLLLSDEYLRTIATLQQKFFTESLSITDAYTMQYGNWLTGWLYRKSHEIEGSTVGELSDYQVRVKVHYGVGTDSGEDVYLNEHCRTDFGDVRFTSDDGVTEIPYWMEEKVDGDYAIFWIKVPSIPASPDKATIYIYYGKSDAMTTSDGDATFLYFADFEDCTIGDDGSCEGFSPLAGATWEVKAGKWYSGKYVSAESWSFAGEAWTNYAFKLRTYLAYHSSNINFRVVDKDNHYLLVIFPAGTKKFVFYKRVSASYTQLAYTNPAMAVGNWYAVEIKIVDEGAGTRFKIYFNDNLEINYLEDPRTFTSGKIGFRIPPTTCETYWDDLIVRKYVDPEPSHGDWGAEESLG